MERWRARCRPGRIAIGLALAVLLFSTPHAWAQPARRAFDIPAGAMIESLNLFARQAGVRVLFPYDLVSGKRTPAVRGQMTPDDALARLLADSGVEVADRQDKVLLLRRRPAPAFLPPSPGARGGFPRRPRPRWTNSS